MVIDSDKRRYQEPITMTGSLTAAGRAIESPASMGQAKRIMMEWEELGIVSSDGAGTSVCAECIEDPDLQEFVITNLTSECCDYCGKSGEALVATAFDDIIVHMAEFVNSEWTDPVHELRYETREGGYQGHLLDNWQLIEVAG